MTASHLIRYAPAVVLGIVRAATIAYGAALIRGDEHQWLLVAFGLAVAAEAIRIEHKVVERLIHPTNPTQSWAGLLPTFLLVLVAATGLNALAAFQVVHVEIKQREESMAQATYWAAEGDRIRRWLQDARSAVATAQTAKQQQIDQERGSLNAARAARAPYSTTQLTSLGREMSMIRALATDLGRMQGPPLLPPATPEALAAGLTEAMNALDAISVRVAQVTQVQPLPSPKPPVPPTTDLVSMFMAETRAFTPRARAGWLIAFGMELMSFCALYQGGRRTPVAERVADWKSRTRSAWTTLGVRQSTVTKSGAPAAMPFRIEPGGYTGSLRHHDLQRLHKDEVASLIAEVLTADTDLSATRINRLTTPDGLPLDHRRPVLEQLDGAALTVVVEAV